MVEVEVLAMAWRRGFFRLWLVASILWVAAMAMNGWSEYDRNLTGWRIYTTVPVRCIDVRGERGVDWGFNATGPGPWDNSRDIVTATDICWQPLHRFKTRFPEVVTGRSDTDILRAAYRSAGQTPIEDNLTPTSWHQTAWVWSMFAITVPLGFLVIGWVIGWIIGGFRRPSA